MLSVRLASNFHLSLEKKKKKKVVFALLFDFLKQIAPFKLHVSFSRLTREARLVKSVNFIVCHCQHLDFKFLWQTTDNKIEGSLCNYYSLELTAFMKSKNDEDYAKLQ